MGAGRWLRHLFFPAWRARRRFPRAVLAEIEAAIGRAESRSAAQICFAVETALDLPRLWRGAAPRECAIEAFARLHVWDTEGDNGVLIYLLLADHDVEIVADRAAAARIPPEEWEAACRAMEEHFRAGRFGPGALAGIERVGELLARHFPPAPGAPNERPDRPVWL
jgi:uncharacterized membrane protein